MAVFGREFAQVGPALGQRRHGPTDRTGRPAPPFRSFPVRTGRVVPSIAGTPRSRWRFPSPSSIASSTCGRFLPLPIPVGVHALMRLISKVGLRNTNPCETGYGVSAGATPTTITDSPSRLRRRERQATPAAYVSTTTVRRPKGIRRRHLADARCIAECHRVQQSPLHGTRESRQYPGADRIDLLQTEPLPGNERAVVVLRSNANVVSHDTAAVRQASESDYASQWMQASRAFCCPRPRRRYSLR